MPSVLITGASDGIGRALVECYRSKGWTVIAHGRRQASRVAPQLPAQVKYVEADLNMPTEDTIARVAQATPDSLDLAILNAGMGVVAPPERTTPAQINDMIAVNTTAPLLLAQALFPRLQAAQGKLTFIGSTAARGAHRDFAVYAATKAALSGAARSLRLEWEGRVPVQIIHPGPTATGMHDKAGLGDIAARKYFTAPDRVARAIETAIEGDKPSVRFGPLFMLRHAIAGSRT
ncbi:SDR family NAD(P)-dependent oxidoreductase [Shimia ponticola]|uniref:SDR family NAD(P)-dependent oxidoreductase n=1 Tax=Shimia ponticola TaxID=2582893 RepID=UPI0011BEBB53|nr:SDR family oxidoreductase [Shimia ponticola]